MGVVDPTDWTVGELEHACLQLPGLDGTACTQGHNTGAAWLVTR